jgi:cell division protein FtsI/penicillin-binding protein 2
MKEVELSWRYSFLGAIILVFPLLVALQLVRIQTNPEWVEKLLELSAYWENEQKTIAPPRGQIYDRWGNLLAGNRMVYEVGVELELVEDPQMIAQTVSPVLGTNYNAVYEDILAQASLEPSMESVHAVLVDNVLLEDIEKLESRIAVIGQADQKSKSKNKLISSFSGLVYTPHLGRIYPEKTLASNIIGFVSREGQEGKGYFGIEERFNDILAAKTKTIQVPLDPNRVEDFPVVPNGENLILTIDREIQRSMEEIIDAAVDESGSTSGTLVVIDPKTGEIMALAMTPRMDLNEFWSYSKVFP